MKGWVCLKIQGPMPSSCLASSPNPLLRPPHVALFPPGPLRSLPAPLQHAARTQATNSQSDEDCIPGIPPQSHKVLRTMGVCDVLRIMVTAPLLRKPRSLDRKSYSQWAILAGWHDAGDANLVQGTRRLLYTQSNLQRISCKQSWRRATCTEVASARHLQRLSLRRATCAERKCADRATAAT